MYDLILMVISVSHDDTRSVALIRISIAALLILAAAVFLVRGPAYGARHGSDFVLIYSPARAWLTGANPYNLEQVDQAWLDAGGEPEQRPSLRGTAGLLYPPSTPAMTAPFAAFKWPAARTVWIAANVGFFAVCLWGIAALAGFRTSQRRTWLFIAAALLFAPVHTTFRHGQTPLYVLAALGATALVAGQFGKGGLIAIAALLKPHFGLPYLAYKVVERRWKAVAAAVAACLIVTTIAVLPMTLRDVPWRDSWIGNLQAFTSDGQGDPTRANPLRHQLINLHYPLHGFIENRTVVQVIVLGTLGAMAAAFFWPARTRPTTLHAMSMIAALSLMVAYHRFYDAVFLLFPFAWVFARLADDRRDRIGWCVLALMIPYFLNMATMLDVAQHSGRLPVTIVESWWWDTLVMPVQAWALLAIAACLLAARLHGSVHGGARGDGSLEDRGIKSST